MWLKAWVQRCQGKSKCKSKAPSKYTKQILLVLYIILKVTLSLALVWLYNPYFIPNFNVILKWEKLGTVLMKLGISSQDLQDFIMTILDLVKNMSSSKGKANAKLVVKLRCRAIYYLGEKTSLVLCINIPCLMFSSWQLISSPVLAKLGASTPIWGSLQDNSKNLSQQVMVFTLSKVKGVHRISAWVFI